VSRLLVIPAAGRGSRLGFDGPKALCPVNGRTMLEHLLARYAPLIHEVVVVAAPEALDAIGAVVRAGSVPGTCVVQARPEGMLPAILCATPVVERRRPEEVWITWCDQIAISATTVARLGDEMTSNSSATFVFPTVMQSPPYIHFARDEDGRLCAVLQRREGDPLPATGESDAGLFAMRGRTFLEDLGRYGSLAAASPGTGERNFLPFIPWLAQTAEVRTFPLTDPLEAVGVNTPADLAALEAYLRARP
jgi:bifunctional UDP-N-acetylglucosamine pyrophosphorylase/glucosamine-1-phosphate N-acetyltransferase